MIDIDLGMGWIGFFLTVLGAGTSDHATNRYSFPLGVVIAVIGLLLMFFSVKENRNPARLRRKFLSFKQDLVNLF